MTHYTNFISHDSSESLSVVNFLQSNSEAITDPRRFQAIRNNTEKLVLHLVPVRSSLHVTSSTLCQGTPEADILALLAMSRVPVTEVVTMFLIEASGRDIVYRSRACVQLIPSLFRTGKCDSCIGLLENIKHREPGEKMEEDKQEFVKDELSCKNFEKEYDMYDNLSTFDEDVNVEFSEALRVIKFTKKIELIDKVKRNYKFHDGKKKTVNVKTSQCQNCDSPRFFSEENLAKHIKNKCKGKAKEACPFCDFTFRRGGIGILKHVKLFHETQAETEAYKNFFLEKVSIMRICSHCGIEYPKRDFTAHNAHCKGKDLVTCHICGKEVRANRHKAHVELHQKDEIEVCPHCGKLFDNKARLRNHVTRCKLEKGSFKCPECDTVFSYKAGRSGLYAHIRKAHRQEYKYNCDQCEKKFEMKYRLDEHITAVHDKIKPFICDMCGFKTAKHTNLNIHRKKSHGLEWLSKTAFWEMIQSGRHPYIDQGYEYLELMRPKTAVILNQM